MDTNIVCVSGYPAAGKSTATSYLESQGFPVIVMGEIVREKAQAIEGIDPDKGEKVGQWAIKHREDRGKNIFARYTIEHAKNLEEETIIIDGLRDTTELEHFQNLGSDVYLFFVTAPLKVRYHRIVERGRDTTEANFSFEEFKVRDSRERDGGLEALAQQADETISNVDSETELYEKVNSLLEEYDLTIE